MNGIWEDFKIAGKCILNKKILLPYAIVWVINIVNGIILLNHNLLPYSDYYTTTDAPRHLLLFVLGLAIANLVAESSVSYSLACKYQKRDSRIFQGFGIYGWRFIGLYLLMALVMVLLVFTFFRFNFQFLYQNIVANYFVFLISNIFVALSIVAMVVDDVNPVQGISKGIAFLISKFGSVIGSLLLAYSVYFGIEKAAEYWQLSSPNILSIGVASLISYAAIIWTRSLVIRLYLKHTERQPDAANNDAEAVTS